MGCRYLFSSPRRRPSRTCAKVGRSHDCPKSRNVRRASPRGECRSRIVLFTSHSSRCVVVVIVVSFLVVLPHHRAQMPVILHPPVPFMDITTPLLHRTSTSRICVNYYIRGRTHAHLSRISAQRWLDTGPGSLLLPPSVACREFQGVMFRSRSLSSVSEPFTPTLGQGVEIFMHNEIWPVSTI
jgi:hypothetical protein